MTLQAPKPQTTFVSDPGKVYPAYQVGALNAVDGGAANILPISHLGCRKEELSLHIRKNGKAVEFQRNVMEGGAKRKEVQNFNLPYQVNAHSLSARYSPNEDQGTLHIRLGKISGGGGTGSTIVGEYKIMEFLVPGQPGSTQARVNIGISQTNDYYKFSPGPSSPYDTAFEVFINGTHLEFRSNHSFPDGDAVKSVTSKQSVNLPVAPLLEQLEPRDHPTGAKELFIWHKPRASGSSGGEVVVPDTAVMIQ